MSAETDGGYGIGSDGKIRIAAYFAGIWVIAAGIGL